MKPEDARRRVTDLPPQQRAALEQLLLSRAGQKDLRSGIPRRQAVGPCPASFTQQRLWFIGQLEPGTGVYNVPDGCRLGGALDVKALKAALAAIVERHEALRTTFASADGTPMQVVGPPRPVEVRMLDVSTEPEARREDSARRLLSEEAGRPFDLGRDLMMRAALVRLAENDHVLLIVLHHVATDGWSSQVLRRELSELYSAFASGRQPNLPELPLQYADFSCWQDEQLQGAVLEDHLAYWRKRLAGAPLLELPTDRPRPPAQTHRGAQEPVALSAAHTNGVRDRTRRLAVPL